MDVWSQSSSRRVARHGRHALALLAVCTALAANGCGYALAGHGSYLPATIKIVGIPPVENDSAVPRIEQILTERVRLEFINRNKYRVINDEAGANAILRIRIVRMDFQPSGLNQQQLASRYLVTVVTKVSFVDVNNPGQPLWSNDALTFRDEYELGSTNAVNGATLVDQQRSVADRITTDAARTIVTAIFEAF